MNEDRVLATEHGHYDLRAWDGLNRSGITPLSDKVLVLCDEGMSTSRGGLIITDQSVARQTLASTTGIAVAMGPMAFLWDADRSFEWKGERPEPGMRIMFQRFAGQEYTGKDGRLYRLIQDRQIGGHMGMADRCSAEEFDAAAAVQGSGSHLLMGAAAESPFAA